MVDRRFFIAGVGISHPDRVMFETAGTTKLGLARYYEAVAGAMIPHVADRPLTLVRCPLGVRASSAQVHKAPECAYMRHAKAWGPSALRRVRIREKTKIGEYLVADSAAALVSLAQMDIVEIHTWNSRCANVERPDRLVVDLDPGPKVAWKDVVEAARLVRALLDALGLVSAVKTTGGRGLHVVVPLLPRATWDECLTFARHFAEALVRQRPERFTTRFARDKRGDRILVDYLRNNRTNTSIAAYSTRARPDAPVSVPLAWEELTAGRTPDRWTMRTVARRLATRGVDPWRPYWTAKQTLPRAGVAALERL
jgi:bifunctional non-homologous end joining protein LigD